MPTTPTLQPTLRPSKFLDPNQRAALHARIHAHTKPVRRSRRRWLLLALLVDPVHTLRRP